ncbi:MAG: YceI family protein [Bacteroidales bacterium]|nr:YceI family protein [Bacteroidales bacterium]MBK7175246.1 YceI family protein [Bacteroidales bacterium]
MKRIIIILSIIIASGTIAAAQKYMTKNGTIRFFSDGQMEKIEAFNHQVNSALDISTGSFVFKVLIKSFEFEKALMQEHFNENYMQSDQFPTSTFNGKVTNLKDINFAKDGTYKAVVEGDLTMHGITNKIKTNGTFEIKGGKVTGKSTLKVLLKDYNISIPKAVMNNIAESIQIDVTVAMDKLSK